MSGHVLRQWQQQGHDGPAAGCACRACMHRSMHSAPWQIPQCYIAHFVIVLSLRGSRIVALRQRGVPAVAECWPGCHSYPHRASQSARCAACQVMGRVPKCAALEPHLVEDGESLIQAVAHDWTPVPLPCVVGLALRRAVVPQPCSRRQAWMAAGRGFGKGCGAPTAPDSSLAAE
jgi:hypothetical protein